MYQVKSGAYGEHLRRLETFIEAEEPEWQQAIDEAIRRFESAEHRNVTASASFGRWVPDAVREPSLLLMIPLCSGTRA